MTVEAALQCDLKGAEAQLAVLPGRGFDQVLLPLLDAWIKTGLGEVDAGLQALAALQGEGGTGVLHDVHAALITEVAGRSEAAAQLYERLLAKMTQTTRRITQLAGSFFERTAQHDRTRVPYHS